MLSPAHVSCADDQREHFQRLELCDRRFRAEAERDNESPLSDPTFEPEF
jgi:hypothetical protein